MIIENNMFILKLIGPIKNKKRFPSKTNKINIVFDLYLKFLISIKLLLYN